MFPTASSHGSRSVSTHQPTTRMTTTMVSLATSMLRVATTTRAALESAVAVAVLQAVACLLVLCLQVLRPLVLPHHLDHVQIFLVILQGCSSIYRYIHTEIHIGEVLGYFCAQFKWASVLLVLRSTLASCYASLIFHKSIHTQDGVPLIKYGRQTDQFVEIFHRTTR